MTTSETVSSASLKDDPKTSPYPIWAGDAVYNTGDRVIFGGIPYQAKWWTQGSSPAAASSNPDSSPWTPITVAQINALNAKLKAADAAK